jgi:mono/diheme cytochrome c family protein
MLAMNLSVTFMSVFAKNCQVCLGIRGNAGMADKSVTFMSVFAKNCQVCLGIRGNAGMADKMPV